MGRRAWWTTVHGVAKCQTRLSMHAGQMHLYLCCGSEQVVRCICKETGSDCQEMKSSRTFLRTVLRGEQNAFWDEVCSKPF